MAMLLRDDDGGAPKRTFVWISQIPPTLLQVDDADAAAGDNRKHRDPRFERLRRTLADNTTGLMQVMHLEDAASPYALALFADEADAMAACLATIASPYPQDADLPPLRLRILQTSKRSSADEVYRDELVVDGQPVSKDLLAPSRGLSDAYRGICVPKWCQHTQDRVDCPLGQLCRRIHLAEYQVTVKRKRQEDADAVPADPLPECLTNARTWMARLVPDALSMANVTGQPRLRCTLPKTLLSRALDALRQPARTAAAGATNDGIAPTDAGTEDPVRAVSLAIMRCVRAGWRHHSDSCFVRLEPVVAATATASSGHAPATSKRRVSVAPWDWALYDTTFGLQALRAHCPLPANGIPTPLERDRYIELLLATMNATVNRFQLPTTPEALNDDAQLLPLVERLLLALAASPRTQTALSTTSSAHEARRGTSASASTEAGDEEEGEVDIVIEPWLPIPSLLHEVVVMVRGGAIVSMLQRHGNVRYCTRDDGVDVVRALTVPLQQAAASIRSRMAQDDALRGASCAIRCCVVGGPQGQAAPGARSVAMPKVVVMSVADYNDEADASTIFLEFDNPSDALKPVFNFTKHFTFRLFPRDVLDHLKAQ